MYLAVDFGTSSCKKATMYLGQPLLLHPPGVYGLPTAFYYDRDNGILVGQEALEAGQGYAAVNLKNEVKMDLQNTFTADGKEFTALEMVKEFYKTLVQQARQIARTYGIPEEIEGMVISVPAKFTIQERDLLVKAARECIPGTQLNVTGVIKEPVAAALSYFNDPLTDDSSIMVFDLGGGTCDVALVREDTAMRERFVVEDADMIRLGGRDWDAELVEYLVTMAESRTGVKIRGNAGYMEKVRRAAVMVKHQLSDPFRDQAMARMEIQDQLVPIRVSRATFDEITSGLLRRALDCMEEVYDRNKGKFNITEIVCVGGSSNMPQIEAGIRARFPRCNIHIHRPEHAVVNGAAIYANMLGKDADPSLLSDFTSFSYGVRCYENYERDKEKKIVVNIIRGGSKLPATGSHTFSPVSDTHKRMLLAVYESENRDGSYPADAPDKCHVGEMVFELPKSATKNTVVTCNLTLDQNGLLQVRANDDAGHSLTAEFRVKQM